MDDKKVLLDALKLHGHCCWASVVECVPAWRLRVLGVKRSGGTQLYGIVETGEERWSTWSGTRRKPMC